MRLTCDWCQPELLGLVCTGDRPAVGRAGSTRAGEHHAMRCILAASTSTSPQDFNCQCPARSAELLTLSDIPLIHHPPKEGHNLILENQLLYWIFGLFKNSGKNKTFEINPVLPFILCDEHFVSLEHGHNRRMLCKTQTPFLSHVGFCIWRRVLCCHH